VLAHPFPHLVAAEADLPHGGRVGESSGWSLSGLRRGHAGESSRQRCYLSMAESGEEPPTQASREKPSGVDPKLSLGLGRAQTRWS
jgi:hypothetical protein